MPITYRVDRECKLVLATAQGVLTEADLRAYVRTVLSDSQVRPGFNELIDLRNMTSVEVSTLGVGSIVDVILKFAHAVKESKTALVASDLNVREVSRLYETLWTRVPATVQLFREMAAARAWLGLPVPGPNNPGERRLASRTEVRFAALCRSGLRNGAGVLVNISASGAQLECQSIRPATDSIVTIQFDIPEREAPIKLRGKVVRQTKAGFAVQFLRVTPELLELVGDPSTPVE